MRGARIAAHCLVGLIVASAAVGAQTPGNVIAVGTRSVFEVFSTGGSALLASIPTGQQGLGACPSADNRGVAVLTYALQNQQIRYHVLELKSGVLRTLGVATKTTGLINRLPIASIVPDQSGDYVAATTIGVLRFNGLTGTATTVQGARDGIAEHLNTGGWLTFGGASIYARPRSGRETLLLTRPGPVVITTGDLFADTRDR